MYLSKLLKNWLCIIGIFLITGTGYAAESSQSSQDETVEVLKQIGEFLGKTVTHMGTLLYGTDMDANTQAAFYSLIGQCIAANVSGIESNQTQFDQNAAHMQSELYDSINTEQASDLIADMAHHVPIHGNPDLKDNASPTNSVNMDSLVNKVSIGQKSAEEALSFIKFVSNVTGPFQQPYSEKDVKARLGTDQGMQESVARMGTLMASTSVGLSNYYYLYHERLNQAGLGESAKLYHFNKDGSHGDSIKDASPLQVDEFMAKRRVVDPNWYTYLAALPPAAIQRELTTILAEIRYELFKQRILKEREVATLSAVQLELAQYAVGHFVINKPSKEKKDDKQ